MQDLKDMIRKFVPHAKNVLGYDKPVKIILRHDPKNADILLGRTAYYSPSEYKIVIYTTNRHPKDCIRSLAHELVHHTQNCRGEFDNVGPAVEGYMLKDKHLRKMEEEAYLEGNCLMRIWEDTLKYGSTEK
jgi:Zn-dependent peptidase ImmA (M78 family)